MHAVDRVDWRGVSTHPYKIHPLIKARGVPTFLMFEGEQELIRADDDTHFENEDMMRMFSDE